MKCLFKPNFISFNMHFFKKAYEMPTLFKALFQMLFQTKPEEFILKIILKCEGLFLACGKA